MLVKQIMWAIRLGSWVYKLQPRQRKWASALLDNRPETDLTEWIYLGVSRVGCGVSEREVWGAVLSAALKKAGPFPYKQTEER